METKYYVYTHKDKVTGEVLYVGKGSGGRAYGDWHQRPYIRERVDIDIVKEFEDKMLCFKYEEMLTKHYHELGEAKFNKKEGEKAAITTRVEFSEMYVGENNPNYGNTWSEEQKSKISGENNGMYGKPSPVRKRSKLIYPNGEEVYFNFVGEAYQYFRENFNLSMGTVKTLLKTGETFKPHLNKHKKADGIRMEYLIQAVPKIIVVCGVDRSGKGTFINELNKQGKYKHITVDRATIGFKAYCKILNKDEELFEMYDEMEKELSKNPDVLVIYLDCSTEVLIDRCIKTDHEILDFDYHKAIYEYYFENSLYKNKIKVDTSKKHVSQIVSDLIKKGVI